jgi:adenylate cyclase
MRLKIFFILLGILSIPLITQSTPTEILKLKVFDAFVEKHKPSEYFTIINIDESTIKAEGGWPLPRSRIADITEEIFANGAIGVGWVLSFVDKDRFENGGDDYLYKKLSSYPTVVATFSFDNQIYPSPEGTVILGEDAPGILLEGHLPNIPGMSDVTLEGIVSAPVDVDNLVRRLPLMYRIPDGWVPSFGTQVYKLLTGSDTYVIKTNEYGLEEIRVKGIPPVKVDSLGRKWISWVDTPETTLSEMQVANKFVFVGVTGKGIMPQVATSSGELLEPHKIQAALAESILIPNSPYIPDWHLAAEILIFGIFCLLIWLLTQSFGVTNGLISFLLLFSATGYTGAYMIGRGILLDFSYSLVAGFITGAVSFYLNFEKQYKLRQQIKKQFEHYLDPRQVKRLQDNPDLLKLGGEKRYCTYLFTDVRGFTALSEKLEPEQVTKIMNKALTIQANAVQRNGGMVDKYIGDAMMAIFNAPMDLMHHEEVAVKTGLQIRDEIKAAKLGIEIGIGINSGPAVVGNMGSDSRFDYSAIGDAVNTAARLESATKDRKVDILIGKSTEDLCGYHLQKLKPIAVKGKSEPLEIYTI